MFRFINNFVGHTTEMLKLIREQNNIGFDGFFEKSKIKDYIEQCKRISSEKAGIQLITPQQSIFVLSDKSHEKICIPLIEFIYNKKAKKYRSEIGANYDVANCINNGIIYIKEHDYDLDLSDCNPSKKRTLKSIIRMLIKPERYFWIFIPHFFNEYQYDELKKIIDIRKKYQKLFGDDTICVIHYLDNDTLEHPNYFDREEALQYIFEELQNYVREIPVNPNEQILVETNSKSQKVSFVNKVPITSVISGDSSIREKFIQERNTDMIQ